MKANATEGPGIDCVVIRANNYGLFVVQSQSDRQHCFTNDKFSDANARMCKKDRPSVGGRVRIFLGYDGKVAEVTILSKTGRARRTWGHFPPWWRHVRLFR